MTEDRHLPPFILSNPLRVLEPSPLRIVAQYLPESGVICDLGSGPGYFTEKIAKMRPKAKVIAIDPDSRAVDVLRRKVEARGLKNVEAHLSRASELGFIPDGSVDFIFSHLMLCCAVDHRGAVAEALRILRGGGMIFMSVTGSGRKSRDVRDVDSEEWEGIMHLFNAFASGRSVAYRWFLGRKGAGKDY